MFEDLAASTTAARSTKGAHTTASQSALPATSGTSARINAPASPGVLYIFQLPAITGLRMFDVGQVVNLRPIVNRACPLTPHSSLRQTSRFELLNQPELRPYGTHSLP